MSTTTVTPAPSKLSLILNILNAALAGLAVVPVTAPIAGVAEAFLGIFQGAAALYQQETGKPIDLTLIPLETPVLAPPSPNPVAPVGPEPAQPPTS